MKLLRRREKMKDGDLISTSSINEPRTNGKTER